MHAPQPVLVGVDAGATKSVAIAVDPAGHRLGRATGPGANPKRHGLETAADRIAGVARRAATARGGADPDLVFVAGAGIDRPEHAVALQAALAARLAAKTRVLVVNDALAVLRAATPDGVGLAVPVSTGGNVIGRAADGRVTDRGHGIFGGGYVLGALAMRAARREPPLPGAGRPSFIGARRWAPLSTGLRARIDQAGVGWVPGRPRRPAPEAASLAAAVIAAAEAGDRYPHRMVERWCARIAAAVREEVERLDLGPTPAVVVYGGLAEASPWLAGRITDAVRAGAPGARLVVLGVEPAAGAAELARDAWAGAPMAWAFTPRR